jgi:recombination protein RecA
MAKKKNDGFEDLLDEYKKYVVDASKERPLEAVSTGSLSIDVSTGIGGIPKYRWSVIWGPESSGKTTLALNIAKNVIKGGGKVLYIEPENCLDYPYINLIVGEDLSKNLILVQPETSEQAFEIAEAGIKSNDFALIVFDSIGSLAPEKEKEDGFRDANIALVARQLGKFLRRNSSTLKRSDSAFLFVNQIRSDIGTFYSDVNQPGGHQLLHFTSLMIRLYTGRKIKEGDKVIGTVTKFVINKNKVGIPYRSHEFYITFGKGIDEEKDAVKFAELLGVLKKRGPFYYLADENIGQGLNNAIAFLETHEETLDTIKEMCYNYIIGDAIIVSKEELIDIEDDDE